jgi:hypothetical protein
MTKTRRDALQGLAAMISGGGLATGLAGVAQAADKLVPIGKLFPFLDVYLDIQPIQRTRFALAYRLRVDDKAPGGVELTQVSPAGARSPIPMAADGRLLRLPTLAELKAKTMVEIKAPPGKHRFRMITDMVARVAPATTLDAADLNAAIGQCQAAIRSKAGVLGFAAPKIKRVVFTGAGSGTAVNAQGVGRPLPVQGGFPAYDPEQMPGIVSVKLARAPSQIILDERPK